MGDELKLPAVIRANAIYDRLNQWSFTAGAGCAGFHQYVNDDDVEFLLARVAQLTAALVAIGDFQMSSDPSYRCKYALQDISTLACDALNTLPDLKENGDE